MKARIYDMEILSSISYIDIITYLQSENWVKSDTFGQNAFIFELGSEELLVPTSKLKVPRCFKWVGQIGASPR